MRGFEVQRASLLAERSRMHPCQFHGVIWERGDGTPVYFTGAHIPGISDGQGSRVKAEERKGGGMNTRRGGGKTLGVCRHL